MKEEPETIVEEEEAKSEDIVQSEHSNAVAPLPTVEPDTSLRKRKVREEKKEISAEAKMMFLNHVQTKLSNLY